MVTALVDVQDESAPTRVVIQGPAGIDYHTATRIGLEMPPERTYFFDADTGDAPSVNGVRKFTAEYRSDCTFGG